MISVLQLIGRKGLTKKHDDEDAYQIQCLFDLFLLKLVVIFVQTTDDHDIACFVRNLMLGVQKG